MLALVFALTAAAEPLADLTVPQPILGPWRARAGDDPSWADPDLDDADWLPVELGKSWGEEPGLEGAHVVWYRVEGELVAPPGQELAIAAGAVGAWEIYLDGQRVATHGAPGSRLGRIGMAIFPLPPDALPADGPATIAIRVWCPPAHHSPGGRLWTVWVGDRRPLGVIVEASRLHRAEETLAQRSVALVALLVGALHLLLFARRRERRAYLWFGLAMVLVGAAAMTNGLIGAGQITPFPGFWRVTTAISSLGYAAAAMFAREFFGAARRPASAVASIIIVGGVLQGLLHPQSALFGLTLWAVLLPAVPWTIHVVAQGVRKRLPGARTVAAGAALFVVGPTSSALHVVGAAPDVLVPWLAVIYPLSQLALVLAMVLALADQFASTMDELEATNASIRRFVPFEFLERIGRTNVREVQRADAVRLEMTLMFFDVRGFTTLAEARPPDETFGFVSRLLGHLEPHVRGNGGFVNQFTGDGFLALFSDADGAARAAVAMMRSLDGFDALGAPIRAGIGLHTGTVVLGTLGGRDQLLAGVVADAANLASRIEGMTKLYGSAVLMSGETRDRLTEPERFALREIDRVIAKGRRTPITLYELLDAEPEPVRAERISALAAFADALGAYRRADFAAAAAGFAAGGDDPAARALAERCQRMIAGTPEGWDGTWRLEGK